MDHATNTLNLTTSTIDAGVIAVAGDVTNVTSVSQVNVVSDRDLGTSHQDAHTQAHNTAKIVFREEGYDEDEDGNPIEPEPEPVVKTDHPDIWNPRGLGRRRDGDERLRAIFLCLGQRSD